MKKLSKYIALLLLPALVVAAGCSKDKEDETKPYMYGSVTFDLPAYALRGQLLTLTASGIQHPSEVEYRWYAPSMAADSIRGTSVTLMVPDSIGSFTVTATALADGFYASSKMLQVSTIDTARNTTLSGLKYRPASFFTDNRDGRTYATVRIGNLEWFAENLGYDGAGSPYMKARAMQYLFGRFYTWDEATGGEEGSGLGGGPQGVCPEGWTIPTREDWEDFATAISGAPSAFSADWDGVGEKASADASFYGNRMWEYSPDNAHSNTFGWNGIPAGGSTMQHGVFRNSGKYGFWWSSSLKTDDQAWFRYIYFDRSTFPAGATNRNDFGANVRCVRVAR